MSFYVSLNSLVAFKFLFLRDQIDLQFKRMSFAHNQVMKKSLILSKKYILTEILFHEILYLSKLNIKVVKNN